MGYIPEEFIKQAMNFLCAIKSSDRLVVVYHGDPDGCCAAVMLSIALTESFNKEVDHHYWVGTHQFTFTLLRDYLVAIKPTHVVFLDVNIESKPQILDEIITQTKSRILIYDDHVTTFSSTHDEILFINPTQSLGTEFPLPACVFAYELQQYAGERDTQWIAAVGITAESVGRYYGRFLDNVMVEKKKLSTLARLITAQFLVLDAYNTEDLAFSLLIEASRLDGAELLLNTRDPRVQQLHQIRNQVDQEVRRNANRFVEKAHFSQDVSLYTFEVRSNFRIVNLVASTMKWKLEKSVILTYQYLKDRIMIEIRTSPDRENTDLTKVLERAFTHLPYLNMGGHPVAAGASIDKSIDINTFLQYFYEALKEQPENAG
jgi:single-stranded DNA-specific DHH superfamily exonuclease